MRRLKKFLKGKTKVVFALNSGLGFADIRRLKKLIRIADKDKRIILLFNLEPFYLFESSNEAVYGSDDLLLAEDYEKIDDFVFNRIPAAYRFTDECAVYHGIDCRELALYENQKFFTPRIKNIAVLANLLKGMPFDGLVCADENGELADAVGCFCESKGIGVFFIRLGRNRIRELAGVIRSPVLEAARVLLDKYALGRAAKEIRRNDIVLYDPRALKFLEKVKIPGTPLIVPLEHGLALRWKILKDYGFYLPLQTAGAKGGARPAARQGCAMRLDADYQNYDGVLVREMIKGRLEKKAHQDFARIRYNIDLLNSYGNRIKAAVVRNDNKELEKTIVFCLRKSGGISLLLQHGVLAGENGHHVVEADKFAAWGRGSIERYLPFGNAIDKFVVTGNPAFDRITAFKPPTSRDGFLRDMGLDASKKIVLFASQQVNKFSSYWTDGIFARMAHDVIQALKSMPGAQLVIKADPYEETRAYEALIEHAGATGRAVAVRNLPIYELISCADLVITLDSTVGLEGLIMQKNLITYNPTKRADRVPYALKNASLGVYRAQDLSGAIHAVMNDGETINRLKRVRDTFIEEYAYKLDGKSGERLLSLIRSFL